MATSFSLKVKALLSSLETTTRAALDVEKDLEEIEHERAEKDGLKRENAELREQNDLLKDQNVKDAAAHADQRRRQAQELESGNDEIEKMRAKRRALTVENKQLEEKRDNMVAGLASLADRFRV